MNDQGTRNRPERQRIGLGELVRESTVERGREISVTRIGFILALLLFGYLSLVSVIILVDYFVHTPAFPPPGTLDAAKLQEFQQVSQVCVDRTVRLFDQFVLKGFLPVFTAVLGYIFGTRGVERTGS